MCTVIITVPERRHEPDGAAPATPGSPTRTPVRLLAIRDEDPDRPWDRLGAWWPDAYPGVVGIRDARAGGAWLAANADQRRLAVLLNRADLSDHPDEVLHTRGTVALESVVSRPPVGEPAMHGFNLVEVTAHTARVVSWDGVALRTTELPPGTHMVAHGDVDDLDTARIAQWLPEFRGTASFVGSSAGSFAASFAGMDAGADADGSDHDWWEPWLAIVERSAQLAGTDDTAIIRRQTFEGIPSYSLLIATATVGADGLDVRDAPLPTPGEWASDVTSSLDHDHSAR